MKKNLLQSISIVFFLATFSLNALFIKDIQAQAGYPVIDTTKLNAHYDFSGSFRDSTGNNAAAVPHDAELTGDRFCNPQNAVLLSNSGSYLQVDDHASLDFTDTLSISFWVYLDSLPESETRIISKSDPAKPDSGSYWISIYPDNQGPSGSPWSFSYTDTDGTIQTFRCEWGIITEHWMHYTVTFDGSMLLMYMGLEPCAEFEITTPAIQPGDDPLWFGNSVGSGITGKLDDILLYERVIQIQELESISTQSEFWPDNEHPVFEPELGDTIELVCSTSGPFMQYRFMKGSVVIQEGLDSICTIVIESMEDYGEYSCEAYNCLYSHTKFFELNSCVLYDDIYIYDVAATEIYMSEGDEVNIWFYVNSNLEGLEYEMYHNGSLIPDVFRGIYTIDSAAMADIGAYYFVVINGCERLVSDTVYLIMEGSGYVEYEVAGWDWTGNISSAGSS
ncbi:MAG: LamG-like jellyroll fold domain-containing protein, partial [Bacteroidota bacterium]